MMITLMALFLRPVGFDYRSKLESQKWRNIWDWALVVGGVVPPIIFGVAFGNLLQGVPFSFDEFLRPTYHGNFFGLLNPLGLLAGVVSLAMILTQGATWLMLKTTDAVYTRARTIAFCMAALTFTLFTLGGFWVSGGLEGYMLKTFQGTLAASDPLQKEVLLQSSGWMQNYALYPWMQAALF